MLLLLLSFADMAQEVDSNFEGARARVKHSGGSRELLIFGLEAAGDIFE